MPGDPSAGEAVAPCAGEFADYVAARTPALMRTAFLLTGKRPDAEDLVQTALAKTYLAYGRIRDKGALDAYVRRTMVTTQTSFWRRRARGREFPTGDPLEPCVTDRLGDPDAAETAALLVLTRPDVDKLVYNAPTANDNVPEAIQGGVALFPVIPGGPGVTNLTLFDTALQNGMGGLIYSASPAAGGLGGARERAVNGLLQAYLRDRQEHLPVRRAQPDEGEPDRDRRGKVEGFVPGHRRDGQRRVAA